MSITKIEHIYLFEWFEKVFLESILINSVFKNYSKWDIIIQEWEKSDNAYIIISWIVWVFKDNKNINTIFEWDIFWEISLITNEPRTASIIAQTDIEVLVLSKENLLKIINTLPNWDKIKTTILNRIIQNNDIK